MLHIAVIDLSCFSAKPIDPVTSQLLQSRFTVDSIVKKAQ